MFLHLNETVEIQLTDRGRSILKQEANNFKRQTGRDSIAVKEDAEGWSSWTLWELMNVFGSFVTPGQEEPFHCKIKVLDGALSR
jgi:hypothetical protein